MNHGEAFHLMLYRCESLSCRYEEWIWNSRDGVTPFGVDCRRCGRDALHEDWHLDRRLPIYDPAPGDRYFRDGLPEEARAIVRRRLEDARGTPYELPEEDWPDVLAETTTTGWPMLVVRGTDADALPQRGKARG